VCFRYSERHDIEQVGSAAAPSAVSCSSSPEDEDIRFIETLLDIPEESIGAQVVPSVPSSIRSLRYLKGGTRSPLPTWQDNSGLVFVGI
jgi:hypothetical protein